MSADNLAAEVTPEVRAERLRFGYADPPYIGQAKRLYGDHPDYAGEVDHAGLIRRLCVDFPQGWALSLSMKSLRTILPMCPDDVLVLSWVKPIAPPMGDHRHYSWEPVILRGGRRPQRHVKSHLVLSPPQFTFRETPATHVIGEKPEGFCHWLFEAAGLLPGDEVVDLFPGSGAVGRAWESFKGTGPATALWRTCETCGASPHERCVSLKTGRPTAIHASRARWPLRAALGDAAKEAESAESEALLCVIRERIGPPPRTCPCSLITTQGGRCAYGPRLGETYVTPPADTEEPPR